MIIGNTDLGKFPVILAPLGAITNPAFLSICRQYGTEMVYTGFILSEALVRAALKSSSKMLFGETERPIGI